MLFGREWKEGSGCGFGIGYPPTRASETIIDAMIGFQVWTIMFSMGTQKTIGGGSSTSPVTLTLHGPSLLYHSGGGSRRTGKAPEQQHARSRHGERMRMVRVVWHPRRRSRGRATIVTAQRSCQQSVSRYLGRRSREICACPTHLAMDVRYMHACV